MQDIPRYFREQMAQMRAGSKRGFTPPKVTMTGRDASLVAVTEAGAEASLFYAPFKEMPGVSAEEQTALRAQALKVIAGTVQPAYRELLKFMREEYVPHTRTTLAAYDLPDGKAFYRAKIKELFSTPAKAWWKSAEDPNIRVLKITPDDAEFWDSPGTIISYVKMAAAAVTGTRPDIGENRKISM
jgi:hypothetical protein